MTAVTTNRHISGIHAALMAEQLKGAKSRSDLERIALRHGKFLLGADRDAMREAFRQRAATLGAR